MSAQSVGKHAGDALALPALHVIGGPDNT